MKYSIIVATYNRASEIQELMASLSNLDFPTDKFELVIVDDGSTDGTKDLIDNATAKYRIRYLRQENKGPGEARNFGMREAQGEYFIFLDSDCTVPVKWLSHLDIEIVDQNLDAFGGPDTYHESFSPLLKAINYSMTSFIGTGGTRGKKKSIGKFYPRSFNMGVHRKVFGRIGGMNKLRHGQDMDFSARIYEAGFKVGLIPEAFVYHKRRTDLLKFFRQIFNWGVARVNLGRTHRQLLKPVHFLPSFAIVLALFILLGSVALGQFWIWKLMLAVLGIVCVWAFLESIIIYKSTEVAFLSIFTLNIQVLAYGLGMLWAWPQSLLGNEAKGFVKGYYGKKSRDKR